MKKFFLNIYIAFQYFFHGMRAADDIIMGNGEKDLDGGVNKENKKINEQHKVLQDLLRGEVTEEVKECRYEMYHAERESKKYIYNGGGNAKKKKIFGYTGLIYNPTDLKVSLVQENNEDIGGVYSDMDPNKTRDFQFKVTRDFIPTSKIEEYAKKVIVFKGGEDETCIFDIYFDNYVKQFDRRSRIFHNDLNDILNGDKRSELLDFISLSFITKDAYGSDDNIQYEYTKLNFIEAKEFEGSIILRFVCKGGKVKDLLEDVYHEETAKKIAENAPRENNNKTADFMNFVEDEYDNETASELIENMKNGSN